MWTEKIDQTVESVVAQADLCSLCAHILWYIISHSSSRFNEYSMNNNDVTAAVKLVGHGSISIYNI